METRQGRVRESSRSPSSYPPIEPGSLAATGISGLTETSWLPTGALPAPFGLGSASTPTSVTPTSRTFDWASTTAEPTIACGVAPRSTNLDPSHTALKDRCRSANVSTTRRSRARRSRSAPYELPRWCKRATRAERSAGWSGGVANAELAAGRSAESEEWHKAASRRRWSAARKARWEEWRERHSHEASRGEASQPGRVPGTQSRMWVRGRVPREFLDWVESCWAHDAETQAMLSEGCFEVWER